MSAAVIDTRIAAILQRATGLEPALLGPAAVCRALQVRMHARGLGDIAQYARLLAADAAELQILIEAVVVPETWFFRHPAAFGAPLARLPRPASGGEPLRILCAPCSTGEEAYSIAIALLDAGLSPAQFDIDARDISAAALSVARRGIYGRNAFRSHDLAFRARHFAPHEGAWRINDRARASVRFGIGNLVARDFGAGQRFDAIFCRNVLIYFPREVQSTVLASLSQRLVDEGLLFVGPAEGSLALAAGLRSAAVDGAFAFVKAGAGGDDGHLRAGVRTRHPGVAGVARAPDQPARRSAWATASSATPAAGRAAAGAGMMAVGYAGGSAKVSMRPTVTQVRDAASAPASAPAAGRRAPLAAVAPRATAIAAAVRHATALSDAGRLDAADAALRDALASHGPSADAFYLKGALADARGRADEALDCYRKALYLDAAHRDALLMLSARLEAQGDRDGARRLLTRARRAETHGHAARASGDER